MQIGPPLIRVIRKDLKASSSASSPTAPTPERVDNDPFSSFDTPGVFPYDAASFVAPIAKLIYLEREIVKTTLHGQSHEHVRVFERQGTQAVVSVFNDHTLVAFRGTRKNKSADWITDFKCCRSGNPKRHRGFSHAWKLVARDVFRWIRDAPKSSQRLILTGHSLGGALATLAAFYLSNKFPVQAVVTFGAPRVGGRRFMKAYNQRTARRGVQGAAVNLGSVTWRLVHQTDLISDIPPPPLYWHVGNAPIYVCDQGFFERHVEYSASDVPGRLSQATKRVANFVPTTDNVSSMPWWYFNLGCIMFFHYIGGWLVFPVGVLRAIGHDILFEHPMDNYMKALPNRSVADLVWQNLRGMRQS